MDARCDWGCGGGVQYPMQYCPWCSRPQHWNEEALFEGTCPHCGRGVDDLMNSLPLVRRRFHRSRSDSARADPGAPSAPGQQNQGLELPDTAPPGRLGGRSEVSQHGRDRAALCCRQAPARRNPLDHAGWPDNPRAGAQLPLSSLGVDPHAAVSPSLRRGRQGVSRHGQYLGVLSAAQDRDCAVESRQRLRGQTSRRKISPKRSASM